MPVKNNNDNAISTALQVHGYHTKNHTIYFFGYKTAAGAYKVKY